MKAIEKLDGDSSRPFAAAGLPPPDPTFGQGNWDITSSACFERLNL